MENHNKLFDMKNKINENNKLSDIINIPGSIIYPINARIIEIYNEFLKRMNISNNIKANANNVIIQEASENDYNFNYILININ